MADFDSTSAHRDFEDLSGQTFGKWTVIGFSQWKGRYRYWNCRCQCGTEKEVSETNFRYGQSNSCGCDYHVPFDSLEGQKFGMWTIGTFSHYKNKKYRYWNATCDCGKTKTVEERSLKKGISTNCGCIRSKKTTNRNTIHGLTNTPEYNSFMNMIARCENESDINYHNYGGRGVFVCPGIRESVEHFVAAIGRKPGRSYSVDRINNETGSYTCGSCKQCIDNGWPLNIKWSTQKEQCNNQRKNILITVDGETHTITQWADLKGIEPDELRRRIRSGRDPVKAILRGPSTPEEKLLREQKSLNRYVVFNGEKMTIPELSRRTGVNYHVIRYRLQKGYTIEQSVMNKADLPGEIDRKG